MSCHDSEALGVLPCLELAYVEEIAPHRGSWGVSNVLYHRPLQY